MEKKTIIWHKSTEQPEFVEDLIFMVDDIPYAGTYANGCFYYAPDTNYEQKFTIDRVDSWAYVYQVIATSKALDVAIDALTKIEECPGTGKTPMEIAAHMAGIAYATKIKISEIIGGK